MNEYVLTLDLSLDPTPTILSYRRNDGIVTVRRDLIERSAILNLSPQIIPNQSTNTSNQLHTEKNNEVLSDSGDSSQNGITDTSSISQGQQRRAFELLLEEAKNSYATIIVVVVPPILLTTNLATPPAKKTDTAQAISMMLEDNLPFDPHEFLFDIHPLVSVPDGLQLDSVEPRQKQHQTGLKVRRAEAGQEQVKNHHISGIPNYFIRDVIESCQRGGFDPHFVCTPSSLLSSALDESVSGDIVEDSPAHNPLTILIYPSDYGLHQLLTYKNKPIYQRFVPKCDKTDSSRITKETTLLALWAEKKLKNSVGTIHFIESPSVVAPDQKILTSISGAEVTAKAIKNRMPHELAATAYLNGGADELFGNMRSGDLSKNPLTDYLKSFLPAIIMWVLIASGSFSIFAFILYQIRETQIVQLEDELYEKTKEILPSTNITRGDELNSLKKETSSLSRQLSDLSSAITISPIDALTTIFRDLPESKSISLNSFELIGKAVRIKGTSNDYAEIEKLENFLRKRQTRGRKQIYCRIKKELPPSTRMDKVAFRFDLRICNVD